MPHDCVSGSTLEFLGDGVFVVTCCLICGRIMDDLDGFEVYSFHEWVEEHMQDVLPDGLTPLMLAARDGDKELMEFILFFSDVPA